MALFEGRILITDCSNKDDRDVVIANLLNHKLSRATLYIMVNDFKAVNGIRQKFPTVVPFVLIPGENVDQTRRMLKLLPHMDSYINFLGQDVALEFLSKRSDFRIKSVSKAYARSSIIEKILVPSEQGIIFNVGTGDKLADNVVVAGSTAKKSIKGSVKKAFNGLKGASSSSSTSSTEERAPLLPKEHYAQHSEPPAINNTANHGSSGNKIWRFLVFVFYFSCPCVNDERVVISVNDYPVDLDAKLIVAFADLYRKLEADWFQKLIEARRSKERAIQQLQNTKEERVEKEYRQLVGVNNDLTSPAANRFQAFANVRSYIRLEKEKINQEFEHKTDLLYMEHYHAVVEKQIEMLISFWKKMRWTP